METASGRPTRIPMVQRPRLIPVLDLRHGVVVGGVGGRRSEYRPIESPLVAGAEPLVIARAIQRRFGISDLYVADLDAILEQRPCWCAHRDLIEAGFRVSIDAGARSAVDVRNLLALGAGHVVAGLETSAGPETLAAMHAAAAPERLIFSLDLQRGAPLVPANSGWQELSPLEIAQRAASLGVQTILVLDLAGVGVGEGLSTLDLCREIARERPGVRVWTGGGVRGPEDVALAGEAGVEALLVSASLHAGRLDPLFPQLPR